MEENLREAKQRGAEEVKNKAKRSEEAKVVLASMDEAKARLANIEEAIKADTSGEMRIEDPDCDDPNL